MEQVNVVDRDYTEVEEAENDVRKKASPKVKLTEISKKAIDTVFNKARERMNKSGIEVARENLDETKTKIEETRQKIEEPKNFGSYIFNNIKISFLEKKVYKLVNKLERENRRALRVEQNMKKSIVTKYLAAKEKQRQMDVEQVNRDNIAELINRAYEEKTNDIQPEVKQETETTVTDKIESPVVETPVTADVTNFVNDDIVSEEKAEPVNESSMETTSELQRPRDRFVYETDNEYNDYLQNFYAELFPEQVSKVEDTTYRLTKDEIIQDDLSVTPEFKAPAVIPEFQHFFDSIRVENEKDEFKNEVEEKNTSDEDIVAKVNESLNDQNITSDDLIKLREALELERTRKNKLTEQLEEKMKQAAEAEKEAAAALQEQKEKMKLVQDELAAYKEENKRLETQTQEVEESTQRQISKRQQSLDYINSLNEMMGSRAVNVVVKDDMTRGGK